MQNTKGQKTLLIILAILLVAAIVISGILISRLRTELNERSASLDDTNAALSDMTAKQEETAQALTDTQTKLEEANAALSDMTAKQEETAQALTDTQTELEEANAALSDMTAKQEETAQALTDTQTKLEEANAALNAQGKETSQTDLGNEKIDITTENFLDYYNCHVTQVTAPYEADSKTIHLGCRLTYELKPEYADRLIEDESLVQVSVSGEYDMKKIASIDWETGRFSIFEESYNNYRDLFHDLSEINGATDLAERLLSTVSSDAEGSKTIEMPLNRFSDGAWHAGFSVGYKGPIEAMTPEEYSAEGTFVITLKDLTLETASGTLTLIKE